MVRKVHVVGYVVWKMYLYTAPYTPFQIPVLSLLCLSKVMQVVVTAIAILVSPHVL